MPVASGPFDVKLIPQDLSETAAEARLGRNALDKQFHGDLAAHSRGEMLSALGEVKGSAAYVAIERVDGTLDGKRGSFALVHTGTMARGASTLTISVVPDSGTGELAGLSGAMSIKIVDGKHTYSFDYALNAEEQA
ncbi:MAG: DUF3224 domain-containing protein [Massilia sp.]